MTECPKHSSHVKHLDKTLLTNEMNCVFRRVISYAILYLILFSLEIKDRNL